MKEILHQDSIRFVMQGGRWGANLEQQAASFLLSNHQAQNSDDADDLAHPIISAYRFLPTIQEQHCYQYHSQWRPSGYLYISCVDSDKKKIDLSDPSPEERRLLQAAFEEYYSDHKVNISLDNLQFRWMKGFNRVQAFGTSKVRVGDNISIFFANSTEYIFVQKCLVVTKDSERYCFIFPLWYSSLRNDKVIPIVSKWAGNEGDLLPIPADFIEEQVFVMHNCKRDCYCESVDQEICTCNVCQIRNVCFEHATTDCSECYAFDKQDVHATEINEFMVFTSALGFQTDF